MKNKNITYTYTDSDADKDFYVSANENSAIDNEPLFDSSRYGTLEIVIKELQAENKKIKEVIKWWVEEKMKYFADTQYGKKELRELINYGK